MIGMRTARQAAALSCGLSALLILAAPALVAQEAGQERNPWPYMPNDDIGAGDFKAAHPTYDGRGVVIAILDTGVDAFAPGLTSTSQGGIKLIETRDFSTEGDWSVEEAEREVGDQGQTAFRYPDGLLLEGAEQLPVPPPASEDSGRVFIGVISEEQFINSIGDLNDDGDEDDSFGFLVYLASRERTEAALGVGQGLELLQGLNESAARAVAQERKSKHVWLVAVDTDGDGSLADEKLLRDYHVDFDAFRLVNENAPESKTMMAWTLNVVENETQSGEPLPPTVSFHFDDGSHGSHCAGIAAGHDVSGQPGMDGVAPGAWLMSLKLGDNRLAGGATRTSSMKKSYQYAAEFSEKYGLTVVCNMSFGIASVEEGEDAMGKWLDDFLADHPGLYVCQSAGNEGPGLSTIGLPATAQNVIASGAYLSPETGRVLYNTPVERPTLFTFSSRGGEAAKPDIIAPGSALSSVPGYVEGSARYNGTSMASPETAGAVACLLSGALQENLQTHWGMVRRALIAGARRIDGLALFDQGGGLVRMEPAWGLLQHLAPSESAHQLLGYRIETPCAFQSDGLSDAAYWRTPGGTPLSPETILFTVHPVFHPDLTPDQKDTFFRSFTFSSEADWLRVIPGKRYIRGDMGMEIEVRYDGAKLQQPGVYSARIIASLDGGDLHGLPAREFYLWNTVVVGEDYGPRQDYTRTYTGKDVPQAWIQRTYANVPAGSSAMRVRLEVSPEVGAGEGALARTEICDPEGHVHGGFVGFASVDGDRVKDMTVLAPDLQPGTWEVDVATSRTAQSASAYKLTISFDGYATDPDTLTSLSRETTGDPAEATLTVTRQFKGYFRGDVNARIQGFQSARPVEITDADEWTYPFTLDRQTPRASFHLEMDKKTGNLFTDCAVNILDDEGRAVSATGFDGLVVDIGTTLPEGSEEADYTLQVVGAFALAKDMAKWGFDLDEKYYLARPVDGEVTRAGGGDLRLYSGVPTKLDVEFTDSWPEPPEELGIFGRVQFLDQNLPDKVAGDRGGRLVLEVPIRVGP
jgi:tripeptidyl-peptidase-2